MNNLAPMKNCPGVQGNLDRLPGYIYFITIAFRSTSARFTLMISKSCSHSGASWRIIFNV